VKTTSDEQIIKLLTNERGKEQGCRLLLNNYGSMIHNQVLRMVHQKQDADDVMQNVMMKVLRGISSFEAKSSLYSWLYRIAHNESINHINKRKLYYKRNSVIDLANKNPVASSPSPESSYIMSVLNDAINELPKKQKLVFELRYFNEKSYREMSELLKTSEGALKASYHHAVKKIELQLSKLTSFSHGS